MTDELTQPEARSDTYLDEVEMALSQDPTLLGEVYNFDLPEELDANQIAKELGIETSGFVYNYRRFIEAIVDVESIPPSSPSVARQCASALRGFAKRHRKSLSAETLLELQDRAEKCSLSSADPAKWEEEEQKLESQTSIAEKEEIPGIYVYTLPHYLRYPVEVSKKDGTADRTLLKVGMSKRDAKKRVQDQVITALPEPPILLRIYVCSNGMEIAEVERKIHRHLASADHVRSSERGTGQEWFLTHLKLLDSTAELLGLKTHFAIDDPDDA
ncbi:MAG: GIY-YIG nuclease family protein [Gemmatimonadetes bacterium]|nr:GIY-YIG nuclease family protein [Rhodothermaceae bacterium]MYK39715.1 GIY-YIG nuclease family protein [Gemmatimonadota bacterium]